jgi:ABC-type dipeptide/oligopeptide/nickel transport system permease subunit
MDGLMAIPDILLAIAMMAVIRASVSSVDRDPRYRASCGWSVQS